MEFLVMISSLTFGLLVFLGVFSSMYQDNMDTKKDILVEDFAYSLQTEFLLASEAHDGYIRQFELLSTLEGYEYAMGIDKNTILVINYSDKNFLLPIPYTNGNPIKGINILKKLNETICINC